MSIHLAPLYLLVPSVSSIMYSSLPFSAALSLNFAPAETSSSTFPVKIAVSENDVVICPVLILPIITTAKMRESSATPKAVYII